MNTSIHSVLIVLVRCLDLPLPSLSFPFQLEEKRQDCDQSEVKVKLTSFKSHSTSHQKADVDVARNVESKFRWRLQLRSWQLRCWHDRHDQHKLTRGFTAFEGLHSSTGRHCAGFDLCGASWPTATHPDAASDPGDFCAAFITPSFACVELVSANTADPIRDFSSLS